VGISFKRFYSSAITVTEEDWKVVQKLYEQMIRLRKNINVKKLHPHHRSKAKHILRHMGFA
jgi:hypothetical protein